MIPILAIGFQLRSTTETDLQARDLKDRKFEIGRISGLQCYDATRRQVYSAVMGTHPRVK